MSSLTKKGKNHVARNSHAFLPVCARCTWKTLHAYARACVWTCVCGRLYAAVVSRCDKISADERKRKKKNEPNASNAPFDRSAKSWRQPYPLWLARSAIHSFFFFSTFFAASFRLSKRIFPSLGYQGISGKTKSKLIESAYRKFPDALCNMLLLFLPEFSFYFPVRLRRKMNLTDKCRIY